MGTASVLIVEDDDATRNLLVEYLSQRGLHTDAARDGVEALHCLSTHCYKVVVLDVIMPHMSGIDVLDSLEALDHDPSLTGISELPAVVVITSTPEATLGEDDLRQRSSCVHRLLHKPFDICSLADTVERLASSA